MRLATPGDPQSLARAIVQATSSLPQPAPLSRLASSVAGATAQWEALHNSLLQATTTWAGPETLHPLVSVVLVHHERPELLKQAITSIEMQL